MMKHKHPRHLITNILLILMLCLGTISCGQILASDGASISSIDLLQQIEANDAPIILDVRSPEEYAAGHVPSAINIDYRELPDRLDEVRQFKGNTIVVYCERGVRARIAADTLTDADFQSILHLEGHMQAWRKNKLPTSPPPPSSI